MTHDELRELAPAYALDALTPGERAEFGAHLAECAECRADVESMAPVVQGLAYTVPREEPPAALRARVLGAARSDRAARPSIKPAAVPVQSVWTWSAMAAMAALLVAAAGLGLYALSLRDRVTALEDRLREASAATERADSELAALRQLVEENESARAVLGSSDLARIDLQGQAAAAAARARAFWNRSSGLVFTASDLPAVPEGRTYQLWVLTDGAPVSAGLLQPDAGGAVETYIETPPDLPSPVGMAVTIEPAGGVPAPTTPPILVGLVTG